MSKFKKAIKQKELESALTKHPLRELDENVKKDYVKGLVFIAVEDENFSEDEKSYITSLMSNIGVDEALLSEFETFANEPDEDELLAFMDRIKAFDEDLKVNFLIEVVLLAFKDGDFDEAEKEMFNDYIEMLEFEDKKDDIIYIATALENKDIDLALAIYTAKKEFFEKYDYMFKIIYIDIEKELKDVYSWEWVEFRLEIGEVKDNNLVASKPVSVQQFCIYLNSKLIGGELNHVVNTTQFEIENEVVIKDIEDTNLEFIDRLFKYDENEKDKEIIGADFVDNFCEFVNIKTNNSVDKLNIIAGAVGAMSFYLGIELSVSSKQLLSNSQEKFIANIGHGNRGQVWRYFMSNNKRYFEEGKLDNNTSYTFRIMQINEEEQESIYNDSIIDI